LMSATTQNGKVISAQYATKATFEKGEATITLGLIKHGDQWQILRFNVNSAQLMPKYPRWRLATATIFIAKQRRGRLISSASKLRLKRNLKQKAKLQRPSPIERA